MNRMGKLRAVDIFAGAGGTTQGLRDAGFDVVAAIENDTAAAETFAVNHPETLLLDRDIQRVQALPSPSVWSGMTGGSTS